MDLPIAPHILGAGLVSLHAASVDPRAGISQINIFTP